VTLAIFGVADHAMVRPLRRAAARLRTREARGMGGGKRGAAALRRASR
jgi:hypothetical protein